MLLWIAIAFVTALVIAALLLPLLGSSSGAADRASHDLEVYRDQLRELERDRERGLVNEKDAEAARLEIERRMLAVGTHAAPETGAATTTDPSASPASARLGVLFVPVLAILVPALGVGLYLGLGQPHLPAQPFAERKLPDSNRLAQVGALQAKIKADPGNAKHWADLGALLLRLKQYPQAVRALGEAMKLSKGKPAIASSLGEALTQAAGGTVTKAALAAFRTALQGAPRDPRARYYLGLAESQAGKPKAALEIWLRLEADSPPRAPWLQPLRRRIAALAKTSNTDVAALRKTLGLAAPKTARGPTKDDIDNARRMTPQERMGMIRGMVQSLENRLKEKPDDLQGWRRLGRSYAVLGDRKKAVWAYSKAATLAPKDPLVLADYALALLNQAGRGTSTTPDITKIMRRIRALDANNPLALYYLGIAEAEAGNRDAALDHFRRLLNRLPKDAPVRGDVERRIAALEKQQEPDKKKLLPPQRSP